MLREPATYLRALVRMLGPFASFARQGAQYALDPLASRRYGRSTRGGLTVTEQDFSSPTFARRLVFALLIPAVRVARRAGLHLGDLVNLVELASVYDHRRQGHTQSAIADALNVGRRKVTTLVTQLKTNFFEPGHNEEELGLLRRIEFLVWPEPLSEARILQHLKGTDTDMVRRALLQLKAQARVVQRPDGRYETFRESRIVSPDVAKRVDGLRNMMVAIDELVERRFMQPVQQGLARIVRLYVDESLMEELSTFYATIVYPKLDLLEQRSLGLDSKRPVAVGYFWAPTTNSA